MWITQSLSYLVIYILSAVNYYHKVLHLGCCSSPRSTSVVYYNKMTTYDEPVALDNKLKILREAFAVTIH